MGDEGGRQGRATGTGNRPGGAGDRHLLLQIGQTAPDFEQDTANGSLCFHDWINGFWCVLFSYPADLGAAGTSELVAIARRKPDWSKRGVKIICLSVDSSDGQASRANDLRRSQGLALNFPVIADADRAVSTLYGIVSSGLDASSSMRHLFVIDPEKKVRAIRTYQAADGCDFDEILRTIDDLRDRDGRSDFGFLDEARTACAGEETCAPQI